LPEWQLHVTSFPQTILRSKFSGISSPNSEPILEQKLKGAFKHFESGGNTIELVTKRGLSFEEADKIAKKYADLKSLNSKICVRETKIERENEVTKLERELHIAELQRKKMELSKPMELEKTLQALIDTLEAIGIWNKEHCNHITNYYCMYWRWEQKPNLPYQIGESLFKDGKWFIQPTPIRCAACPEYNQNKYLILENKFDIIGSNKKQNCSHIQDGYCKKSWIENPRPNEALIIGEPILKNFYWHFKPTNTYCALCHEYNKKGGTTIQDLDAKIIEVQKILDTIPISNLKVDYKCSRCGSKGLVAVGIQCTNCERESWWGWFPPKK
jgi:hypothetical protein